MRDIFLRLGIQDDEQDGFIGVAEEAVLIGPVLSFPKIISGRIDDAAQPRWKLRQ
jgi:hypothetical protein